MIVAQWPCVNAGCMPYSAATATSGVYPETALPIGAQNSFLQVSSSSLPNWSAYTLPSSMSTCTSGNPLLSNGTNVVCGSTVSAGLKLPTSASYTSAVNGQIGYDTTANIYHFGVSSADAKVPTFTVTPSSGNCAGWTGSATIGTTCPTLDQIGNLAATTMNTFGTNRLTLAGGVTTAGTAAVTITNANSNANATTALSVTTTGSGSAAIPLVVNQGNSSIGDIADFEHNGTIVASVTTAGFFASQNTVRLTSNFGTAANTSLQTFLTWSLPASGTLTYNFVCNGAYSQATASAVVTFGIQAATANPANIYASGMMWTNGGPKVGVLATLSTTTATAILANAPGTTGTNFIFTLSGQIENPASTANTINIMVSTATAGDQVTILRGTACFFTP